ncbi:MAG: AbrB/MazE/SpoVT family DNA-binding domain-containing protein [Gammaproteobacteria bacterium]|nr:AbrB/MazE/SpoVT family DNA-binding domain-containing protein [Gammaproteobacteria bacterium]
MLTKVFKSGNSQAVRIPKDFQIKSDQVEIFSRGDELVIKTKPSTLEDAFNLLTSMPDDFNVREVEDSPPQERDSWE